MRRAIDRTLAALEELIQKQEYRQVETDKIELKDLSTSDNWTELYKSVNAFLNAEGGMVILGVKEISEKDGRKRLHFTGFQNAPSTEEKLKELPKKYLDEEGQAIDLGAYFPAPEILDFLDGQVCVIYVEKLPEDRKYAYFKSIAYERKLTGDHVIPEKKIKAHREWKKEIENARELYPVPNATLQDLDVDLLNDYITRLNREVRVESLKASVESAQSFLTRKCFSHQGTPTLLGMLVCGKHLYDFVQGRCQVDAYVDSTIQIVQSKQILKENIFPLMESSVAFVFRNIQVGISPEMGGMPAPEYPEKLIRETVNNALAHRDYGSERFVILSIKPNHSLTIENPGSFREEQKLIFDDRERQIKVRRIIPIAKARNPKLADILKIYDRWEGRGIGMSSLTNACLDNVIDLPFFLLKHENEIRLTIPKGKVLDEEAAVWLQSFDGYLLRKCNGRELTQEQKIVLAFFWKSERLNRAERYTILLTPDNNHFEAIAVLEDLGLVEKHPLSPDIYPVYLVDRTLNRTDFTQELRAIFGGRLEALAPEYKEVLEAIYLHNYFSLNSAVSAKTIGRFLFRRKFPAGDDVRQYDYFLRRIRLVFNRLEKDMLIVRSEEKKPLFLINQHFERTTSVFDQMA